MAVNPLRSGLLFAYTVFVLAMHTAVPGAYAQTGGVQAGSSFDERLDAYKRKQLELTVLIAKLNGLSSSTASDPELTPMAWRDAVLASEYVTANELIAGAEEKGVRLRLYMTPEAKPLLNDDDENPWGPFVRAVDARGLSVISNADASIDLTVKVTNTEVTPLRGRRALPSVPLYHVACLADFRLPARVLRGEKVFHSDVVVATGSSMRFGYDAPTRGDVEQAIGDCLDDLIANMKQPGDVPGGPVADTRRWEAWLSDDAKLQARHTAYRASYRENPEDLEPGLDALSGVNTVWVGFVSSGSGPGDVRYTKSEELRDRWLVRLGRKGLVTGVTGAPGLQVGVRTEPITPGGPVKSGLSWSSRVALYDTDCLGVFNGRLVRFAGQTYADENMGGTATGNRFSTMLENAHGVQLDRLMLSNTPAPVTADPVAQRHPDADAVAHFLKTRQRVNVPDAVLAEVSQNIAVALANERGISASRRAAWIEDRNGVPTYNLPRVGNSRSASSVPKSEQAAIDRAIDALELADPLGLYAFNNIWNHDSDRDEVPDTFAARLNEPRPSGAGALRRVYVTDAYEVARKLLLLGYVPAEEDKAASQALRAHYEALQKYPLVVAEYIPANGKVGLSVSRFFRVGEADAGWDELVAKLTPTLQKHLNGPVVKQAPDTLAEADRLLNR